MLDNIRGVVSFEAQGGDIYKFINTLRSEHIICTSQKFRGDKLCADIYTKDMQRVKRTAQLCGVSVRYASKRGIRFRVMRYKMRFGIAVGAVLMLCFVFYFSNTVVTIEVEGSKTVPESQIIEALADTGIYKGRFIPSIDFHRSEQRLRLIIPELSWVGIRHTGSRIVAEVAEAVPAPENVNDDIPCNIISQKDAQITYIETRAGEALRKKGDGVRKGEVIISGVVNAGKHRFVRHAMGVVRGIYSEEMTFTQSFEEEGQVYSGSTEKRSYLDFFGLRLPLFIKGTDAENYDYSETETTLGGLPLGIVHSKCKPFVYKNITYTKEEAEKRLQQKAARYEKNFYDSKGVDVLERKIEKSSDKEKMTYTVRYKLEGEIGSDSELYIK